MTTATMTAAATATPAATTSPSIRARPMSCTREGPSATQGPIWCTGAASNVHFHVRASHEALVRVESVFAVVGTRSGYV